MAAGPGMDGLPSDQLLQDQVWYLPIVEIESIFNQEMFLEIDIHTDAAVSCALLHDPINILES
jgi:hypothetical protein